jgi:hypothetical protein
MRTLAAAVALTLVGVVGAQQPPKPGPEYNVLKKLVGTWETSMAAGGTTSKGTMTYKFGLGGLWLQSDMEGEMFGAKFTGHGMDSYDAAKKKYVSVWFDSMGTSPVVMEGTYDAGKKALTAAGEGPGMDGKPQKYKSVTTWVSDDQVKMDMYMGGSKEPDFTITYKRKK